MKDFNLSRWALEHIPLTRYLIAVLLIGGILSYGRLGQDEDPPFTFRAMVISASWPGATALQMADQVTDKLEKKLQETPYVDKIRSYSKPGETLIILQLRESTPPKETSGAWYQVRKKIGDIKGTLPPGVIGPFFNDEFGDTFGSIFALSGDGYTPAELKDYADFVRQQFLQIPSVAKVELYGVQDEKVYIEFSQKKFAQLGIPFDAIVGQLNAQNAVESTGVLVTPTDNLQVRVTGAVKSTKDLENLQLRANGTTFRLGDFATVTRGYIDPPHDKMRYDGKEVIGLGISMEHGGNIIELGKNLQNAADAIRVKLPVGVELRRVVDQPKAVKSSVSEFLRTLTEAVLIVLAVSFLALGLHTKPFRLDFRPGLVVALTIPLVLAVTFLFMRIFDIDLHKISLGALIIALGLLVDDAIIAVEMMVRKMEEGMSRFDAATITALNEANIQLPGGRSIPLSQLAQARFIWEPGVVWREGREWAITVQADVADGIQGPTVSSQIEPKLANLRASLPAGYHIDLAGAAADSGKAQDSIAANVPLVIFIIFTLLMLQLHSFSRAVLVFLTGPLGVAGAAVALLVLQRPFGFVAQLGVIALFGMIIRNSVILIDQIEQDIAAGAAPWNAIVESAVRRFRPIILTAAAAVLAMIPLSRSVFWGPMAVAIMGGLIVATALTLLFLPALYAAWFRVKKPA